MSDSESFVEENESEELILDKNGKEEANTDDENLDDKNLDDDKKRYTLSTSYTFLSKWEENKWNYELTLKALKELKEISDDVSPKELKDTLLSWSNRKNSRFKKKYRHLKYNKYKERDGQKLTEIEWTAKNIAEEKIHKDCQQIIKRWKKSQELENSSKKETVKQKKRKIEIEKQNALEIKQKIVSARATPINKLVEITEKSATSFQEFIEVEKEKSKLELELKQLEVEEKRLALEERRLSIEKLKKDS